MVEPIPSFRREETPPSWLTESFIENALREGFHNENLKILKMEPTMATSVGDNYGSIMFRLNLTISAQAGKDESLSVIVKATQVGQLGAEMRKASCFEKEEKAFAEVLPNSHQLIQKAYPGHPKLWAHCYYHMGHPLEVLILEDLRPRGFVLGNRFEGLDLDHSLLVIQSLAKLHSTSIIILEQNPDSLELYDNHMWSHDNQETLSQFVGTKFKILEEEVLKWPDWDRKHVISEKLRNLRENVLERSMGIWERNDSKLNVLIHGDAWVNNFMFRYDPTGNLLEMNFVDFQLITRNSPVMDLQYFIYTSLKPEMKFNADVIDLLLMAYHETFEETLNRLQYRIEEQYTLEQLRNDFEDKIFWGFFVFINIFPIFVVPSDEGLHPDDFFKPEVDLVFRNLFAREDLRESFKEGLIYFEEKGCL